MMNVEYRVTTKDDIELLMSLRLEMLKLVNNLPVDYEYDEAFVENSRKYFLEGNQSTVVAFCDGKPLYSALGFDFNGSAMNLCL